MSTARPLSRLALWRLWYQANGNGLGLAVVLAIVSALAIAIFPLTWPSGPPELATGTVYALGITDPTNGRGLSGMVTIDLGGSFITLREMDGDRCVIGQPVKLLKRRTRLGARYHFTLQGCGA